MMFKKRAEEVRALKKKALAYKLLLVGCGLLLLYLMIVKIDAFKKGQE